MSNDTSDAAKHPGIGDGTFTAVTHPEGPSWDVSASAMTGSTKSETAAL
jgi:hypothetical protein